MRELVEIWYDKYSNDKGVHCQSIYIVGQLYGIHSQQCELLKMDRVADMVILHFKGDIDYEVPITDDMSFVYAKPQEEDADKQSKDK